MEGKSFLWMKDFFYIRKWGLEPQVKNQGKEGRGRKRETYSSHEMSRKTSL